MSGTKRVLSGDWRQEEKKNKRVNLDTFMGRIAKDRGISRESMAGGGRNRKVTGARAALAYAWVRHLGRSGHELAKALAVSPQVSICGI
jgi:chromosomal replication initiation ATPase DnaA